MTAAPVPHSVDRSTAATQSTRQSAAQVIGLQRNLTTPTRDRAGHVDLWFEMRWPSLTTAWTDSFTRLAREELADGAAPATEIAAMPIGPDRGYIVARGVPTAPDEIAPVESLVRELVDEANARTVPAVAPPSPARRASGKRWFQAFGVLFGV